MYRPYLWEGLKNNNCDDHIRNLSQLITAGSSDHWHKYFLSGPWGFTDAKWNPETAVCWSNCQVEQHTGTMLPQYSRCSICSWVTWCLIWRFPIPCTENTGANTGRVAWNAWEPETSQFCYSRTGLCYCQSEGSRLDIPSILPFMFLNLIEYLCILCSVLQLSNVHFPLQRKPSLVGQPSWDRSWRQLLKTSRDCLQKLVQFPLFWVNSSCSRLQHRSFLVQYCCLSCTLCMVGHVRFWSKTFSSIELIP